MNAGALYKRKIGQGSFGCVFDIGVPCEHHEAVPKAGAFSDNELVAADVPIVYKFMDAVAAQEAWDSNRDIVLVLDPKSEFLVPLLTKCTNTDLSLARDVCPPIYTSPKVMTLGMPRGIDVFEIDEWIPFLPRLEDCVRASLKLFRGVAHMGAMGIVHGDIKAENTLFFQRDGTFRLIEFDFTSSFTLQREISPEFAAHEGPFERDEMEALFARPDVRKHFTDTLARNNPKHPAARYVFNTNGYFPPENVIAAHCAAYTYEAIQYPGRRLEKQELVREIIREVYAVTRALHELLLMFIPRKYYSQVDLLRDGYDTLVPFFEFLNVAVDSGWPDCTEIFIRSFYPDKHDAFQMGYWLMFMAGAYLRKDEMSADKQDSGLVRRVLLIANALLNPQPFLRITVQEARAALFQALHKLGSN